MPRSILLDAMARVYASRTFMASDLCPKLWPNRVGSRQIASRPSGRGTSETPGKLDVPNARGVAALWSFRLVNRGSADPVRSPALKVAANDANQRPRTRLSSLCRVWSPVSRRLAPLLTILSEL
jgi:hypothetical protein